MADVIAAGEVHQRFLTDIAARDGFAALVRRQLTRTAEQHAMGLARLRPSPVRAMIRWRPKLGQPAQHRQDQSAVRRLT